MALFETARESHFKACSEMVEAVLRGMGLELGSTRLRSETGPAWGFSSGSARVYIFLTGADDGEGYIQVISPVVRPPADTSPLYARLLGLNAGEITGAAFGVRGPDVVLTTDRSLAGLDRIEVEEMIQRVSDYADYYDDVLAAEFGATRCSDL